MSRFPTAATEYISVSYCLCGLLKSTLYPSGGGRRVATPFIDGKPDSVDISSSTLMCSWESPSWESGSDWSGLRGKGMLS